MIHIYTGSGKGKTTAAAGLAVRALGAGLRVCFFQFLKNGSSSEIKVLRDAGADVHFCKECNKFTFAMTPEEREKVKLAHDRQLNDIKQLIVSGDADLIVLDEIFAAYNSNILDRRIARDIVSCAGETELVLTGRSPSRFFRERADYISSISAVKHPYTKGIPARKGIEY